MTCRLSPDVDLVAAAIQRDAFLAEQRDARRRLRLAMGLSASPPIPAAPILRWDEIVEPPPQSTLALEDFPAFDERRREPAGDGRGIVLWVLLGLGAWALAALAVFGFVELAHLVVALWPR